MLRRKTMPPELQPQWAIFSAQAQRVQDARRVVMSCLPVGRVEPAPVAVGLDLLVDELRAMEAELGDWRRAEVEQAWSGCAEAIAEARDAVPNAKQVAAATSELEELLGAVADVLEPLGDAFSAAERRWLTLRRR